MLIFVFATWFIEYIESASNSGWSCRRVSVVVTCVVGLDFTEDVKSVK